MQDLLYVFLGCSMFGIGFFTLFFLVNFIYGKYLLIFKFKGDKEKLMEHCRRIYQISLKQIDEDERWW